MAAARQRGAATARKEIGVGDRGEPVRTALGYIRLSTDMQASEGISREAQQAATRQYCELHRLRLLQVYSEPPSPLGRAEGD